ncbi:hypothetical protein CSKR_113088 [Clonorchis sinensis]|uniref:Uncharacterized protein n=1 Tax=Clonorchis sinensis TaxID=79923 RepID=A0A3R7JH71_CLOSI|nr:hypothetical protein CSKR_113088 [Clonorchis sinensis]
MTRTSGTMLPSYRVGCESQWQECTLNVKYHTKMYRKCVDSPKCVLSGCLELVNVNILQWHQSTGVRWPKWLEREFTDRKVRGSNPTSACDLPCLGLGDLAVSQPSGFLWVAWQLDTERLYTELNADILGGGTHLLKPSEYHLEPPRRASEASETTVNF